jgi:hypothetical protein
MDKERDLLKNDLENQKTPEETKKSVEDAEILGYEDIAEFRKKKLGEIEFMADEISKTSESKISQVNEFGGSSEELEHRTSEVDEKIEEVTENAQNEVGEVEKPSENIQQNEVVKVEEAIEGEQNLDTSGNQKESNLEKKGIKDGVDFVFEQNPGLEKIGTKKQYSEYLDSIFPDSKVKDIVYHYSSLGEKIKEEGFKSAVELRSKIAGLDKDALYFTKSPIVYWGGGAVDLYRVCTLLNIKNPLDFSSYTENDSFETLSEEDKNRAKKYEELLNKAHYEENGLNDIYEKSKYFTKLLKDEGYDSVLQPNLSEIEIFDKQNIYTLGNNQDLENFKKFVEKT